MKKRVKDSFLRVRMNTQELEEIRELAEKYGFDNVAELVRHSLAYIKKNKPILGKDFAPGTMNA